EYNHLPAADFGSGLRDASHLGANTPEAAVTDGLSALQHSDWNKLMSLSPPDEIPFYDYRAAFTQYATDNGAQTDFTVTSMTATATTDGDTAKVVLKASGQAGDNHWSIDGGCYQETNPDNQHTSTEITAGQVCVPALYGLFYGAPDLSTNAITTVKRDGRWF